MSRPVLVTDRRGNRQARARAALLELLLAVFGLPAAAGYLAQPDVLAMTAVHAVTPAGAVVWAVVLAAGSICVIAGHLLRHERVERTGVSLLGLVASAYAASLLPARGDQAGLTATWMLAISVYLVARARRSTTP